MQASVLARWPDAPISAARADGRWLRFDRHPRGVVHPRRYAWEEPRTPHFLAVARGPPRGGPPAPRVPGAPPPAPIATLGGAR
jgi:hypothetical protein